MGIMDDILGKEPEQRTVEFCTDGALSERLSEAQVELERARRAETSGLVRDEKAATARIDALEGEVAQLVEEVRSQLIRFTFAALDPAEYDQLLEAHPPTESQKAEARKDKRPAPLSNYETFPTALVAAACVKVETPSCEAAGLTLEEAQEIWKSRSFNASERSELTNAAMEASVTRTPLHLPAA